MRTGTRLALTLGLALGTCRATDVIVLSNGDSLRGEIKRLEKDVITFSTEYSDSDFKIKWDKVARIETSRKFLVETYDGNRISGLMQPTPADPKSATVGDSRVPLSEIARVRPFEDRVTSRVNLGFDVGYSMTKANGVKQLTAGTDFSYTGERSLASVAANVFLNRQSEAPRTRRWEVNPSYRYLLGRSWFAVASGNLFGSEEQKLAFRSTLGGGLGRYFLRSTQRYIALGAGLAWTSERYSDPLLPHKSSGEAFAGAEYMTKRLKAADLLANVTLLPSLTVAGRFRSNLRVDVDFRLPGDWSAKTGYYHNFDSAPPGGLPRADYGWRNSFGYTF